MLKIKLNLPLTADLLKGFTIGAFAIFLILLSDLINILKAKSLNCNIFFVGKAYKILHLLSLRLQWAQRLKMDIVEYTVSEISFAVKRCVETTFSAVKVKGEIFGAKRADSGHWYLSLKDENAVLAAVCWRGVAASLPVKIEDGLEVVATGKITTFAGKSSYQLVIERLEVAGTGAHRVSDRFPTRIIVWPTPVQGEGAADKIAAAIKGFNNLPANGVIPKPDVLIVARGGGSLEDLWPFNEEVVIRAVYDSEIPLISAVGHETDTMLIDYVSDLRAPTPTGAAEFAVPVKNELMLQLSSLNNRRLNAISRLLNEYKQTVEGLGRGIPNLQQIVLENQQKLDDRCERLTVAVKNCLSAKRQQLDLLGLKPYYINNLLDKSRVALKNLTTRMESVSVESVLKRGFAWVTDRHYKTMYDTTHAKRSGELNVRFIDGIVKTKVVENRDAQQFDLFDIK